MSDYNGSTSRGSRGNYQGNNYSDNRSGSHYNDRPGNNNYNDNRMVQYGGNKTRGGFKSRNRVKRNAGSFRPKSDRYYDDEDVNMDRDNGSASTSRPRNTPYEPRGGRGGRSRSSRGYRGSRGGRSASSGAMRMAAMDQRDNSALARMGLPINSATTASGRTGGIPHSKSGWYKALIPYGAEIGKDFIFNKLGEVCTVPFKPMKFTTINKNCHFFVDSQAAAKALKQCSRMIDAPTGRKMLVSVQACDDPGIGITEEKLAKVKVAMSKRWNMETKLLNLKEMYHDEDLRKDGIFLSIGRPDIGSELLRIIEENIPELTSLDLSSNKLYNLNTLGKIEDKVPNLMALNLADNEIKYERDLEKLKGCSKLIELRLAGNPLCDKFDDKTSYISAIRKILPKILKLDDHDLPPPITFEVETAKLPTKLGNKFPNLQVQNLVCDFLSQYYDIIDSNSRQGLLAAYHENAIFSLSAYYNNMLSKQPGFSYLYDSRNLVKLGGSSKTEKLRKGLRIGKVNVVAALEDFPRTQHDPASFLVDVAMANSNLMQFVWTGVFREVGDKHSPLDPIRAFSRTFITVPQGAGIVIVNEQCTITNATAEQARNAFRQPEVVASPPPSVVPSPVAAAASVTSSPVPAIAPTEPTDVVKQQMVIEFSQKSGMTTEFTIKCLTECAWDFDRAAQAFRLAKDSGQIPPEAFIK